MIQDTDKNQFYVTQDVDVYTDDVDNLMDDLFGDVESTLHVDCAKQRSLKSKKGQSKQSDHYVSTKASGSDIVAISKLELDHRDISTSKDTVNIQKLNLADISLPPISKQDVLWIQPYIMRNPEPPSNIPPTPPESVVQRSNLLDRVLLVFACSSALLAAVIWTIHHGIWVGRQSVNVSQVNIKNTSGNRAFADEIKRMLSDIIDKNRMIAANPTGNIGNNLPLMAAPLMGGMPLANPLANGMQQPMYVPIYQPPTFNNSNSGNAPSPLALPPLTASNSLDMSSNAVANAKTKSNTASTTSAASAPSYTLIGVLDLGDRSTAMLDIGGSVQSVGLGKAFGNTGWSLARVSQQEITLKRGKETKNVFVGQKF